MPATQQLRTPTDLPVIDADGPLRFGGQCVALSASQIPGAALLVRRLGSLVRNDDLLAAYAAGGGSTTGSPLHPVVCRRRRRLAAAGLTLHVVRRRGVVLDVTTAP